MLKEVIIFCPKVHSVRISAVVGINYSPMTEDSRDNVIGTDIGSRARSELPRKVRRERRAKGVLRP